MESLSLPLNESRAALEEAVKSRDPQQVAEQFNELTRELTDRGAGAYLQADYPAATHWFEQLQGLVEEVEHDIEEWTPDIEMPHLKEAIDLMRQFALAWREFSFGMENLRSRTPTQAVRSFNKAAPVFRVLADVTGDLDFTLFAEYAEINEKGAHGLEQLARLNNAAAAATFQFALGCVETMLEETIPPMLASPDPSVLVQAIAVGLQLDRTGYMAAFHLASFRSLAASGDFAGASPHAIKRIELTRQLAKAMPATAPIAIRVQTQAAVHLSSADGMLNEAHLYRETRKWDNAVASYESARSELQKCAGMIAKSGIAEAAAFQEALLNQATNVALWLRQTERERQLVANMGEMRQELASFRTSVFEALKKSSNVSVKTDVDLLTAIKVNSTMSQHVAVTVREAFQELQSATKQSSVDPEVKGKILEKTEEAVQLAEQGQEFLGKAKEIGSQILDIIRATGPAATTLIPAARVVAAVLGIPFPF